MTHFRVYVGDSTPLLMPPGPDRPARGRTWADFKEKWFTILVVEAAEAVPWTKPEELPYAPDQPLPRLRWSSAGSTVVTFVDGSMAQWGNGGTEEMWRSKITIDGQKTPLDW